MECSASRMSLFTALAFNPTSSWQKAANSPVEACCFFFSIAILAVSMILISLRLLQGLALGGEYGGAATYVAEHAPHDKRGAYTSWIQTTATLGLFLSLMVILGTRTAIGEAAFADWGWRVPFIVSIALLAVSVYIRLSMNESPAFAKM